MKRVLIALITTLPLAVGVAAAQAATPADGFPGDGGGWTNQVAVGGTVVSVDATNGTFVANAYVLPPPDGGVGFGGDVRSMDMTVPPPTTTQVTISTNSSTQIVVDSGSGDMSGDVRAHDDGSGPATGTVADLAPNDQFVALFPGSPTDTIETLVGNPATSIFAQVANPFYAFAGTVTAKDTTAGTVTVNVMSSIPSGVIAPGTSATFTVDSNTLIISGSSFTTGGIGDLTGGSLGGVSVGDIVSGGLIGAPGLTAAQVEATPLMFMLDLPAPSTTTGTTTGAANKALKETLKLLHGGKVKLKKSHHRKSHHHHAKKHAGRR